MQKIITAINNPKLNKQLKEFSQCKIIGEDIQYQEGVFEILEKERDIEILILSEILYGKNNLKELIEKIQKITSKIKIIIILEKENEEKIKYLKEKNINNIFFHNKFTTKEIINLLEKENNATNKIEEEIETIKKLLLENNTKNKFKENRIKKQINKIKHRLTTKNNKKTNSKQPQIITVAGSCGTGKSTFSSCLAANITKDNGKTLLIDFDILNNDIHTIFGKSMLPQKIKQKEKNINLKNIKIKINKNLDLICATKLLFENEKINLNELNIILEELKKKYFNIIIDTSSECFFDYQKLLLEKSNKIIFLTDTNLLEIKKSKNLLKIYVQEWGIKTEKILILLNKYNKLSIDEKIIKNIFSDFYILGKLNFNKKYNQIINQNMKTILFQKRIKKEYKKIIVKILNNKNNERRSLWKKIYYNYKKVRQ